MTISLEYTGAAERYFETESTGKQQSWRRGQTQDVSDTDAALLMATGLFAYGGADAQVASNIAPGKPVTATTNLTGGIEIPLLKKVGNGQTYHVESMVGFGRSGFGTPSGLASYPTIFGASSYELTGVTVTGSAGATTLTINSGTVADLSGVWSGTILHSDGVWRTYTIKNAAGSTLDVFPPLEAPAMLARLTNVQDAAAGQHLTETGSFALADYIYGYNPLYACRDEYYERINDDATSGWSLYGGLGAGRLTFNNAGNVHQAFAKATQLVQRTTKCVNVGLNTNAGISKNFTITGKTGYFETYISTNDTAVPARIDVLIDGYVVFREDIFGIRQIRVPFSGAATLECRIYSTALQTGTSKVGATTLWKTPESIPCNLIQDGAKVVWLGDSWTSSSGSAVVRRLQQRGAEKGAFIIPIGKPGEQATWAIANFDKVIAAQPDVVIIEYFVNDKNSLGLAAVETWKARIATLVGMTKAIGARAIVLMPAPTGSQTQCQELAIWSAQLAEGVAA